MFLNLFSQSRLFSTKARVPSFWAKLLALAVFAFALETGKANVFYLSPPARGFEGVNSIEVTTSTRYDSEVESDYLTYRRIPCHFQSALRRSNNFFCASAGSLGSKRFLTDVDFTFAHDFTDHFTFRFHGFQKQDFSTDSSGQVAELFYRMNSSQSLGIHGQFDSFKAEDDIGMSYNFHFPTTWARLELNAYDYSRNRRNEEEDRFKEEPYSVTATVLKEHADQVYYLNVHIEPEFRWEDPAQALTVKRSRHWVEAFVNGPYGFYFVQSRQNLTHVNQGYEDEKLLRLHGEKQVGQVLGGLRGVRRSWKTGDGRLVHYDLLPFVWYRPHQLLRNFEFGYEFTWHRSYGHDELRSQSDDSSTLEHRLNMAWDVLRSESGYFRLLFTFDLDQFGSGETWEGGSGQLAFTF